MITFQPPSYAQISTSATNFAEVSIANGRTSYSMCAWVRPSVTAPCMTSGDTGYIWSEGTKSGSASPDNYTSLYISNGLVSASFQAPGVSVVTVGGVAPDTQIAPAAWSFVAMGRSGTQVWVSVNGQPKVVSTLTGGAASTIAVDTWGLGTLLQNGPQFTSKFAGDMAYVTGWRDYTLTDADLQVLYNGGQPSGAPVATITTLPRWQYLLNDSAAHYGLLEFQTTGAVSYTSNRTAIAGAPDPAFFDPSIVTTLPGLVAFWTFQEPTGASQRASTDGQTVLFPGGAVVERVGDGLFGPYAARFGIFGNGARLVANRQDVPNLLFQDDDQFSIVAWVKPHDTKLGFIAGVWDEEKINIGGQLLAGRQYGLFKGVTISPNSPPPNTVDCHISWDGQGTAPSQFNTDYSAGGQLGLYKPQQCALVTWDGAVARSYLDAVFVIRGPNGSPPHNIYRNPYTPAHTGLFAGTVASFSVGMNHITGGYGNDFRGVMYGLAVFDRVLSQQEIVNLAAGMATCGPTTCDDQNPCTTDACSNGISSNGSSIAVCTHDTVVCTTGLCNPADGACVECLTATDCDDGLYCTGTETCVNTVCQPGADPCTDEQVCDETADNCGPCSVPGACDDSNGCTIDSCTDGLDTNGAPLAICTHDPVVCSNSLCNPADGTCVECISNTNCSDGVFCNGAELCVNNICQLGADPCNPGEICNEDTDHCDVPPPADDIDGRHIPQEEGAAALLASQNTATQMGDNINELNQLFLRPVGSYLRIGLTGNVAADGSSLALFFDTKAGGQNELSFEETGGVFTALNGTTLDSDFVPDYMVLVSTTEEHVNVYLYSLATAPAPPGRYLGRSIIDSHDAYLQLGDNPNLMRVALDDGNLAGVTDVDTAAVATATSGLELSIARNDVGMTGVGGVLQLMALIISSNGEVGNQFLPGVGSVFVPGTGPVNLAGVAGWQFVPTTLVRFDVTGDGVVGLDDFEIFSQCLDVDWGYSTMPECSLFDAQQDQSVNLADFAIMQREFFTPAP